MSHEIRTPMNAITGIIELMRREPLSPRQAENLHRLQEASQHLLAMINDILDMSKIEADKLHLEESALRCRRCSAASSRWSRTRLAPRASPCGSMLPGSTR
jgi:signal transduction histidine kinase